MKKISILVPCYNEENNIEPMVQTLCNIMNTYEGKYTYEIILRDNASTDGSVDVIRRVTKDNKQVKAILNARNFGVGDVQNTFRGRVSGDACIFVACDFQEPPELIPEFIKCWEEGYEVVCGQKTGSREGPLKYGLRQLYYSIIAAFSDIPQYRNISGIILVSRRILEMKWANDKEEAMRYFLADIGCEIKLIPYEQQKRRSGKSSYNVWRYLSFAIDSLITTSTVPLRIATVAGFCMSVLSFLIGLFYLIAKIIWWDRFPAGTAPLLIGMFFIGSVQLLFIGLVGEYVGNVLHKVTPNNPAIVKELINFDDADNDPYLVKEVKRGLTASVSEKSLSDLSDTRPSAPDARS